jgi:hypothetical protein
MVALAFIGCAASAFAFWLGYRLGDHEGFMRACARFRDVWR